jgi:hypothetical protein
MKVKGEKAPLAKAKSRSLCQSRVDERGNESNSSPEIRMVVPAARR